MRKLSARVLVSSIVCALGSFAWAQGPDDKGRIHKTSVENKASSSVEVLKTWYEELRQDGKPVGNGLFRAAILNKSDTPIEEVIVSLGEGGRSIQRMWGDPIRPDEVRVMEYGGTEPPARFILMAVLFSDGLGEGNPKDIRRARVHQEGYLEGVDVLQSVFGEVGPALRSAKTDAELSEWLSEMIEILHTLANRDGEGATGEAEWIEDGRRSALRFAIVSLRHLHKDLNEAPTPGVVIDRADRVLRMRLEIEDRFQALRSLAASFRLRTDSHYHQYARPETAADGL